MASLPSRVSLGGLPGGRAGGVTAGVRIPSQGAVGSEFVNLGKGIAAIGEAATQIANHDKQIRTFETEQKFQEFDWNQRKALDESMRNVQPGQARTFADDAVANYTEQAKEFYKNVPDDLKPTYEAKLFRTERDLYGAATQFGRQEQKRFSTESIDNSVNTVFAPRARTSTTDQLGTVSQDFETTVDLNPDLTPIEKDEIKRRGNRAIGLAHLDALPTGEARKVIDGRTAPVVDRIIQVEGQGKNPLSSASGTGQFINSTWLSMVKQNRPDLAAGKTDQEILALRSDKELGREMTDAYARDNADKLTKAGLQATPGNVYLAHFLGPGGAVKVLQADPNTPVAALVGPDAVRANPTVLGGGKTAGDVAAWSARKMQPVALASLTDADWKQADSSVRQRQTRLSTEAAETFERQIIDARAGRGTLFDRASIEQDPNLIESQRNALLRQWDGAAGDIATLQQGLQKFTDPNGGAFNPVSSDDKSLVDRIYTSLGGDNTALTAVVNRTGMVPSSAGVALRGALLSPEPAKVQEALQTAANLVGGKYPDIFAGVEGGKDLTQAAHTFRDYVFGRGMSAQQATKKIMEERTPEFEAKVRARHKPEDVDAIVKKNLSVNDIRGAFDQIPFVPFTDPALAFTPEARKRALGEYETAFRDNFMRNGDVSLSKKLALEEMKRTWGVSGVSGSSVVMKYPPERAPAYAGIENVSEHVAQQAQDAIRDWSGADIPRKNIRLQEIKSTGERYMNGQAPTYTLSYTDKNGVEQIIPKAFYADPAAMRDVQVVRRAREAREIMAGAAAAGDAMKTPLGELAVP